MDSNPFKIQRLKGSSNWDVWALRMEAYLTDKGYAIAMIMPIFTEGTSKEEINAYKKEMDEKSPKAAAIIRLCLEDGPLIQVKGILKAIDVWIRLKDLYEPKGFSSEFLLCRELFNTTLAKAGHSIEAYLTRIKRLTDDLAARGLTIPNKVIAAYALNNLSAEYENTVAIISQSFRTIITDIDIVQLFSQLIDESRRLKAREPTEMAMVNEAKPKEEVNEKKDKKCTHCHKKGHLVKECWKKYPNLRPKRPRDNNKDKSNESTLYSEDKGSEFALITSILEDKEPLALIPSIPTIEDKGNDYTLTSNDASSEWLLDSGTTKHICANKALFTNIRPYNTTLKWGNASKIQVEYSGDVQLRFTSTGRTTTERGTGAPWCGSLWSTGNGGQEEYA